jgi:hypothetical protein
MKLNYLTTEEFEMQPTAVDVQVAIGIQASTCRDSELRIDDIVKYLSDIRQHERGRILNEIQRIIDTTEIRDLPSLQRWIGEVKAGLPLLGDEGTVHPTEFQAKTGRIKN